MFSSACTFFLHQYILVTTVRNSHKKCNHRRLSESNFVADYWEHQRSTITNRPLAFFESFQNENNVDQTPTTAMQRFFSLEFCQVILVLVNGFHWKIRVWTYVWFVLSPPLTYSRKDWRVSSLERWIKKFQGVVNKQPLSSWSTS